MLCDFVELFWGERHWGNFVELFLGEGDVARGNFCRALLACISRILIELELQKKKRKLDNISNPKRKTPEQTVISEDTMAAKE